MRRTWMERDGESDDQLICNWTMEPLQRSIARALALTLQRWCDPYSKTLLSRISKSIPAAERLATTYSQSCCGAISRHAVQGRHGSTAPRAWGFASHQLRCTGSGRAFSTEAAGPQDDEIRAKFVRFFALFMMAAAGFRVFPYVAASSVGHTLGLLDAQEPFLLRSGISRLQLVLRISGDSARHRALKGGAVPKLVRLVGHEDAGVADGAVQTLDALAESDLGLDALREAGGQGALRAYLQRTQRGAEHEDGIYKATQLLAALEKLPAGRGWS